MKTYIGIREFDGSPEKVRIRLFRMKKGKPSFLGETTFAPPSQTERLLVEWLEKQACQLIAQTEKWGKRQYPVNGGACKQNGVERAITQLQAIIYFI